MRHGSYHGCSWICISRVNTGIVPVYDHQHREPSSVAARSCSPPSRSVWRYVFFPRVMVAGFSYNLAPGTPCSRSGGGTISARMAAVSCFWCVHIRPNTLGGALEPHVGFGLLVCRYVRNPRRGRSFSCQTIKDLPGPCSRRSCL